MIREFIDNLEPAHIALPVLHSCSVRTLEEILSTRVLKPQPCSIFKSENLLYMYYGKPSYRIKSNDSHSEIGFFPSCFIFKMPNEKPIKTFPFDSGIFEKDEEFRNKYFSIESKIKDFLLSNDILTAQKIVNYFYENNRNYYRSMPKHLDIPQHLFDVKYYYNLITSKDNSKYDDRMSSIEFAFDNPIHLDETNLLGVILPALYLDRVEYLLSDLFNSVFVKAYESARGNPSHYHGNIHDSVYNFLSTNNYFEH